MSTIRRHLLALAVVAVTIPATSALTEPVQAAAPAASVTAPSPVGSTPTSFFQLPTTQLPADHATHDISFSYRNPSAVDRTVAPQILIESPAWGPYLSPTDVSVAVQAADGHWQPLKLGTQTGTLYTNLIPAKLVLHGNHTLTEHYRITVTSITPGTVAPRMALYG
ncbi:hypothetical protein [Kitasatospora kifunensis]|uniref:Uncharacterized protein n=1 Tax=Kitasatospora kifunensis TaxID=58351 RepID=A0A7W7VZP2_KITKI|nr:hypothetical protein [Kitasatospora kifunensis]MBB4927900.1 hypothetical protein [Kitasatospora kifunensis]